MADQIRELGKKRIYFYCSSSISNWSSKLKNRLNIPKVRYPLFGKVIFFGLYNPIDYLKFLIHRGEKKVFWCGSDILQLNRFWALIISSVKAKHYCENSVEYFSLLKKGIESHITPMIFDNPILGPSFLPSDKPHVWMSVRPGYKKSYGLDVIERVAVSVPDITFHIYGINMPYHQPWMNRYAHSKNVIYHGFVFNEKFNEEIKSYQSGIRLNEFDGCSEVMAKSVLMGQYPITMHIQYPGIKFVKDEESLIISLKQLRDFKRPNYEARKKWQSIFNKSLQEILK